jgi:outer membrane protein assembly factor BamB
MHRLLPVRAAVIAALVLPSVVALAGGTLLCGTAGDELVAARAGLTREWVVQIPFDSAGWRLEHVAIGDGLVVASSGDGGVHAVSTAPTAPGGPRAGSVLWSHRVGRPFGPVIPAGIGSGLVTVAHDLDLHAFSAADGSRVWHRTTGRPPSAAAVPVGDWVYGPLAADGVVRRPVNPLAPPPQMKKKIDEARLGTPQPGEVRGSTSADPLAPVTIDSAGHVESAPVPYAGGIAWVCEEGILVAIVPVDEEWKRLEFDLGSRPTGPIVVRGESIYAATAYGDLAKILDLPQQDVRELSAAWHVVLPVPPEGGPLVSGETVVVSLGAEGVLAVSDATGEQLWRSHIGGRLVGTTGDRVWLVDQVGRLTSLDLADGTPSEWMCLGDFTLPVTNTVSERLILASPDGLVVSLAPRRTIKAIAPPAPADAKKPGAKKPADAEKPADEEPAAEPNDA